MKRKIILLLVLALIAASVIIGLRFYLKESKKMTGVEWMMKQEAYVEELKSFADETDDVFTLYIVGSMDIQDFYAHVDVLSQELTLLQANRAQYLAAHPVKTGTHTADSKGAVDAVDALYDDMREVVNLGYTYADDAEELSYRYIAAQQTVSESLSKYIVNVYFHETMPTEEEG